MSDPLPVRRLNRGRLFAVLLVVIIMAMLLVPILKPATVADPTGAQQRQDCDRQLTPVLGRSGPNDLGIEPCIPDEDDPVSDFVLDLQVRSRKAIGPEVEQVLRQVRAGGSEQELRIQANRIPDPIQRLLVQGWLHDRAAGMVRPVPNRSVLGAGAGKPLLPGLRSVGDHAATVR